MKAHSERVRCSLPGSWSYYPTPFPNTTPPLFHFLSLLKVSHNNGWWQPCFTISHYCVFIKVWFSTQSHHPFAHKPFYSLSREEEPLWFKNPVTPLSGATNRSQRQSKQENEAAWMLTNTVDLHCLQTTGCLQWTDLGCVIPPPSWGHWGTRRNRLKRKEEVLKSHSWINPVVCKMRRSALTCIKGEF